MSKIPSSPMKKLKIVNQEIDQYIDTGYPIPELYREDRMVALARDSHLVFVYWDISDEKLGKIAKKYLPAVSGTMKYVLRLREAGGKKKGRRPSAEVDTEVPAAARSWYLKIDDNRKKYVLELGLKSKDGKFKLLLGSNQFTLPQGRLADSEGDAWMSVSERYGNLLRLSGIDSVNIGSLDIARFLSKRWEFLQKISQGVSSGMSSRITSPGKRMFGEKPRNFWLIADAELIIYGATDPAASLTINGREHELYPDGTFSLRSSFPDGGQEFVIKAVSGDKIEERKITITVQRNTK